MTVLHIPCAFPPRSAKLWKLSACFYGGRGRVRTCHTRPAHPMAAKRGRSAEAGVLQPVLHGRSLFVRRSA